MNNSRLFQVKVFFIFFMALTIIISYNTLVQSQTQLPDLICTSLSFSPTELEPMEQINLTGYILNDGDAPTGQEFQCNFYLATRPDEVNYNYFVGWFMMHPLAAHSGDNFNIVGEIPSDVPPGYYYVQIGVNTYERIEESNYDNNGTSSTNQLHVLYKPLPNLVCNSLSFSPTEIKAGGPIMLSGSVTNAGDAATGSGFKVKFYLSNSPDDFDQNLLLLS